MIRPRKNSGIGTFKVVFDLRGFVYPLEGPTHEIGIWKEYQANKRIGPLAEKLVHMCRL
jgi:hypothetical protein